ncbi:MAG: endonuclease/exonuclease/phosphatase family protein [Burkholderiaceae bacterium]
MRRRIASLNLLNFQLPDRPIYGSPGYSQDGYRRKLAWTAGLLDAMSCDLVAVQEVFAEAALIECVNRTHTLRRATYAAAPHADDPANDLPRVGLISRLPVHGVESVRRMPAPAPIMLPGAPELGLPDYPFTEFSRPVLRASIDLGGNGGPVARVYVIHLKSRRPKRIERDDGVGEDFDDPAIEARGHLRALMIRAAEASALRQLLLQDLLHTTTPVIVMGDFNDHANAMTTEMITGRHLVRRLARRDHQLWHAVALQRPGSAMQSVGYTKIHAGEPDSIDHVLLSEEFLRGGKNAIGEVLRVDYFNDHLNDADPLRSDHGAIRVELDLG